MQKKYFPLFMIFFLLSASIPRQVFACAYAGEFQACMRANQFGNTRHLADITCIQSRDPDKVLYQIILDKKFKELDIRMFEYLVSLRLSIGTSAMSPLEYINQIARNFGAYSYYYQKYTNICEKEILQEQIACSETLSLTAGAYGLGSAPGTQTCMNLARQKLQIYGEVAGNILLENRGQFLQERRRAYNTEQRKHYSTVLDNMNRAIGYCGSIVEGLSHYTPKPRQ